MEEWRSVVGFESYEISSLGNLRRGNRILKYIRDKKGYLRGAVYDDGIRTYKSLHSLVCATFIGARPDGYVIDHIDNNKQNNSVDNLRYITPSQNILRTPRTNPLHHIRKHSNKYVLRVGIVIKWESFDTLEEAIQKRDQILSQVCV